MGYRNDIFVDILRGEMVRVIRGGLMGEGMVVLERNVWGNLLVNKVRIRRLGEEECNRFYERRRR
jgi:hypothetical protein